MIAPAKLLPNCFLLSLSFPTTKQLMSMGHCLPQSPQGLPLLPSQLLSNPQLLLIAAFGQQLPRQLGPQCMASLVAGILVAGITD